MVELQLRILCDSPEFKIGLANHPTMECITRLWRLKIDRSMVVGLKACGSSGIICFHLIYCASTLKRRTWCEERGFKGCMRARDHSHAILCVMQHQLMNAQHALRDARR